MPIKRSANEPSFYFDISGTSFSFCVVSFEAIEAVSAPFQVNVMLSCEDEVAFEEVAGKEAVLTIRSYDSAFTGDDRYFHGNVIKFKDIGENGDYYLYRARLVPAVWRLSLEQDCRVFQNTTLQSIIKAVFQESGIPSDRYRFALKDEDLKSQYCVQYNETDLNFISRLLEEEGIFYFFEHYKDKHVVVFCDFASFCVGVAGDSVIPYQASNGMVPECEAILAFNLSGRVSVDATATGSFNYKRTSIDLTAEDDLGTDGRAEIYEYAGTYASEQRGKKLSRIRLEEYSSLVKKAKGESNCPRLISGFTFTLAGSASKNVNGEYLLLAIEHVGDQPQSLGPVGRGSAEYWNGFIAAPAAVKLRPSRITPKPVIPGMQTAVVTGPPGEEIYHDKFGRVKVQFHWDRKGSKNDKSSCWLRYAQGWGGGGWGMQFIPRVGDEVLVAFLDGDPDRPVIVGSLFNSANMPLYNPLESKGVSSLKTRSYPEGGSDNFHELRFDDRKGSEELYLQSERDWNILVKNDKGQTIGNDEFLAVKRNRTMTVGVDQSESIGNNKAINVGASHTETIGTNMSLSVGASKTEAIGTNMGLSVGASKTETVTANSMESVGLAKELFVGGAYAVTVVGGMNTAVGLGQFEQVGLHKDILVGKSLKITAGDSVEIVCGESSITMDKSGKVTIKGSSIDLSGSGHIQLRSSKIDLN